MNEKVLEILKHSVSEIDNFIKLFETRIVADKAAIELDVDKVIKWKTEKLEIQAVIDKLKKESE